MIANPDRKILVLWVIAIALITRDELRGGQRLPRPSRYVGSAMVYGIAAVLSEVAGDLAVWLAVGWTLAIAYRVIGSPTGAPVPTGAPRRGATTTKTGGK
jgi:hypothetical protein